MDKKLDPQNVRVVFRFHCFLDPGSSVSDPVLNHALLVHFFYKASGLEVQEFVSLSAGRRLDSLFTSRSTVSTVIIMYNFLLPFLAATLQPQAPEVDRAAFGSYFLDLDPIPN